MKKMSKTPKKGDSKKGLGRGLGELLAQHDTDLPFLGVYGAASGEHEPGLPASAGEDDSEQLLSAIKRFLRTTLKEAEVESAEEEVSIPGFITASIRKEGGVSFVINGSNLPLVPSDLAAPGMIAGELDDDRSSAEITMLQWGIESRRLLSRLCEHHLLTQ